MTQKEILQEEAWSKFLQAEQALIEAENNGIGLGLAQENLAIAEDAYVLATKAAGQYC